MTTWALSQDEIGWLDVVPRAWPKRGRRGVSEARMVAMIEQSAGLLASIDRATTRVPRLVK